MSVKLQIIKLKIGVGSRTVQ